jgi:hypothetical protein
MSERGQSIVKIWEPDPTIPRAHPDYRMPQAQRTAFLAVLRQEGFMQREQPQ